MSTLSKWFRFGKDRNKVGNGRIKRQLKKTSNRTKGFNAKRHAPFRTNLLNDLIAEEIATNEYMVSFRKQPIIGKIFNAAVVKYITDVERHSSIHKQGDRHFANIEHINRELSTIKSRLDELGKIDEPTKDELSEFNSLEQREKAYKRQLSKESNAIKRLPLVFTSSYPKIMTEWKKLQIVKINGWDKETNSYFCTAKQF